MIHAPSDFMFLQEDEQTSAFSANDSSFEYVTEHANSGNAEAQYHLAMMYDTGTLTEHNPQKALDFYTRSAEQRYAPAQFRLARMYESPQSGIEQDLARARYWYEQAASNGLEVFITD
jgi:hypothetical protein